MNLHHEDLVLAACSSANATKKHLPKTPQQSESTEMRPTVSTSSARQPESDAHERINEESAAGCHSGEAVVVTSPVETSLHRHFLDSRQLTGPDPTLADHDRPPVTTPLKSQSGQPKETSPKRSTRSLTESTPRRSPRLSTETTLRRSPRLSTRKGNLMETSAAKSAVSCVVLSAAHFCSLGCRFSTNVCKIWFKCSD